MIAREPIVCGYQLLFKSFNKRTHLRQIWDSKNKTYWVEYIRFSGSIQTCYCVKLSIETLEWVVQLKIDCKMFMKELTSISVRLP